MTNNLPSSIPHSPALSEASPFSLQEEFSRDPEQYQRQNIDFIITEYQDLRARLAASAEAKPPKAAKPTVSTINLSDLGF